MVVGCKKGLFIEDIDYRLKFVGDWEFKVRRSESNTDYIGYFYTDSVYYSGQINLGPGPKDLLIKYTPDDSIKLEVNEGGALSGLPSHYSSGNFIGHDTLDLNLSWSGLGGGTNHYIDGVRK